MRNRRGVFAAIEDARRASLVRGATIYTHLQGDTLDLEEYLRLTPEEFQCLRMYLREEHPTKSLDIVWRIDENGRDEYSVRLAWDIRQINF